MSEGEAGLSERRVLLTGATGGIGRALAQRLAGAGAELLLLARDAGRLGELARELSSRSLSGDLADPVFADGLPERVREMLGEGPDILINNAGAFALAPFWKTEPRDFDRLLAVNLRAAFVLTRGVLPEMLARRAGHVVNIGSVAGRKAFPGNAAYAATKFGLRGLHEVLVEELRGTGVRVTWIEPSAVDTGLWNPFQPDAREDLPSRAAMLPPAAVADAVYFALTRPPGVNVEELLLRSSPSGTGG